ncbi:MAG: hypothetical protein PGN26_01315 [Xylophilus ampelinus]
MLRWWPLYAVLLGGGSVLTFWAAGADAGAGAEAMSRAGAVARPVPTAAPPAPAAVQARADAGPRSGNTGQAGAAWHLQRDLQYGAGLTPAWLVAHGFTEGGPALPRLHALLDGRVAPAEGARRRGAIAFGPQGAFPASANASEMPVLSPHERYVTASLPMQGSQGDAVLVRWRNVDEGTVLELSTQVVAPGPTADTALWKYAVDGWRAGQYRVEVIAADPSLALLAAGEFRVSAGHAALTPFAFVAESPALP